MPAITVINVHNQVLLLKRADNRLWCYPGGQAQKGERSYETALRELTEECGFHLNDSAMSFVGTYPGMLEGQTVDIAVFQVDLPTRPTVKLSSEHVDYAWVTTKQALETLALAGPLTRSLLERKGKH